MTDTPPTPDAAVQIVAGALDDRGVPGYTGALARRVVAALARAGWLHEPAEVERLRAVADAAQKIRDELIGGGELPTFDEIARRITTAQMFGGTPWSPALDAAPAGTAAGGKSEGTT